MNSAKNLSLEEISKYFSCPLYEACIYLNVEKADLKVRMLELGIKKWPYRKYQKKDLKKPEGMFLSFEIDGNSSPKKDPLNKYSSLTPDSSPKYPILSKERPPIVSPTESPKSLLLSKNLENFHFSPKSMPLQKALKTSGNQSPKGSPNNFLVQKDEEEKKKSLERVSILSLCED